MLFVCCQVGGTLGWFFAAYWSLMVVYFSLIFVVFIWSLISLWILFVAFCVWLQAALEVDFAKIEIDIFFVEWGLNSSYYMVWIIWENVIGHDEGWEGIADGDNRSEILGNGEMPVDFDETGMWRFRLRK